MHPVCDFPFTQNHIDSLETALSPGRMYLYRKSAEKNGIAKENVDSEALKLYCWNNALSRAFYWPLHGLEISLRNAMADRMYEKHGNDWYDKLDTLKRGKKGGPNEEVEKVEKAKRQLLVDGEQHGHDSIVSSISFGFWEGLLKAEYELLLWQEEGMFHELFPLDRNQTFKNINQIKRLRNNIAHHEPIFVHWPSKEFRPLYQDYKKVIKVIRWTSPDTASWVEHHSSADFFKTWNLAPAWMPAERKELRIKPNATANGEAGSDNWCW